MENPAYDRPGIHRRRTKVRECRTGKVEKMTKDAIKEQIVKTKEMIGDVAQLNDSDFDEVMTVWHDLCNTLKGAVYDPSPANKHQYNFEFLFAPQSMQFVIDCIPEYHRVLLKYWNRKDELTLLDVGAGSAAGTNLLAHLHYERVIYSRIKVDAVDFIPVRKRWAQCHYPLVNYLVDDVANLPSKNWDLVICNHCLEHVPEPLNFCEELVRVCSGFAFVYAPFKEKNRSPSHRNFITKKLFSKFKKESMKIIKSMAWHADQPDDTCILVVLDCR